MAKKLFWTYDGSSRSSYTTLGFSYIWKESKYRLVVATCYIIEELVLHMGWDSLDSSETISGWSSLSILGW